MLFLMVFGRYPEKFSLAYSPYSTIRLHNDIYIVVAPILMDVDHAVHAGGATMFTQRYVGLL